MKTLLYSLCLFLLTVVISSCDEESSRNTTNGNYVHSIDFVILKEDSVQEKITVPGTILPNEKVDLYPEVSGIIRQIHFEEGQHVKKGTLLFTIDSDILKAEKHQLEVALTFAQKDEARKKRLYESNAGTFESYEQAQSEVQSLEAQLQLIDVQIDKTIIQAPFDGKIGIRSISAGAYVTPSTLLASLSQETPIKIDFSIPQRYAHKARVNQTIEVQSSSMHTKEEATIYAIQPVIDQETRLINIRARRLDHPHLSPGSFVEIFYDLGTIQDALIVPTASIVPVLNGQQVWKVQNGKSIPVLVETGIRTKNDVQIISDELSIGDTIITSGLLGLREGLTVKGKLR